MKFLNLILVLLIASSLVMSCKKSNKELTPDLFIQIENEILKTDMTPESMEKIVEKFGVTLKQYKDYEGRLETEPGLKEKIGEIRLNMHKDKKPDMK